MENHQKLPEESATESDSMVDSAKLTYQKLDDWLAVKDDDPVWLMGMKITLRILAVFLMILLSPFLMIGLFIAFAAVL